MEWGNSTDTESPPPCLDAGLSEVCDDLEGLWGPGWIHKQHPDLPPLYNRGRLLYPNPVPRPRVWLSSVALRSRHHI